jgi:hypothetical protein
MATPVPRAPIINVARRVLSMAAMNVSSVAVGCCAVMANSPKIALAANGSFPYLQIIFFCSAVQAGIVDRFVIFGVCLK